MSSKDYIAIASVLAGDLATSTDANRSKVVGITLSLADVFKRDNPRFDRLKFYDAVGIGVGPNTRKRLSAGMDR